MKISLNRYTLAAATWCFGLFSGLLPAHQMWLEELADPPRHVVRFGEFGDSVEKSPGYLDQLAPVLAWLPAAAGGETKVLPSTKKEDHFLLTGEGVSPVVLAQTGFPVMGKEGAPGRLPLFYLRWHQAGPAQAAAAPRPAMTLDLVPEGKNVVRVFFRSVPVPQAALTLMQAGGGESSLTTDGEGRATIPACPPGLTLLTVNQKEDLPGVFLGKLHDITSHNASLSWVSR